MITLGVLPAELTHRFNKSGHVTPLPGTKGTFAEFAQAMKGSTTCVVPIT